MTTTEKEAQISILFSLISLFNYYNNFFYISFNNILDFLSPKLFLFPLVMSLELFYELNIKVIFSYMGWLIYLVSFSYLKESGYEYIDGVKNYSNYSLNPLIILPFLGGGIGCILIIRKMFRSMINYTESD